MRTDSPPGEGHTGGKHMLVNDTTGICIVDPATVENVTCPGSQRKECV